VAQDLSRFVEPLPVEIEGLLAKLCGDACAAVRLAAATSLGVVLQSAGGFTRTRVVGSWALSAERAQRAAIALALGQPFAAVGAASALELLAGDEDPEVRSLAAAAAKKRLRQLASDPDPAVRRSAR
jgi:hypothetical protein